MPALPEAILSARKKYLVEIKCSDLKFSEIVVRKLVPLKWIDNLDSHKRNIKISLSMSRIPYSYLEMFSKYHCLMPNNPVLGLRT